MHRGVADVGDELRMPVEPRFPRPPAEHQPLVDELAQVRGRHARRRTPGRVIRNPAAREAGLQVVEHLIGDVEFEGPHLAHDADAMPCRRHRRRIFATDVDLDRLPFDVQNETEIPPLEGITIMRTLIVTEFISLDGVIDSPGGGSHPRAGWTFKDVPFVEEAYEIKGREQDEAGALLLGRVSYDEFAPVWPTMDEFAEYNAMPKYVVSSTLTDPEWNNTTVLRSLDEVAALKRGDDEGTILVHAS